MENMFYKFFVKNIFGYLVNDGGKVITNNYRCYVVRVGMEDFVIPKKNLGLTIIYVLHENKIKDKFVTDVKYIRQAEIKFKYFYRKRLFKSIEEYGNY